MSAVCCRRATLPSRIVQKWANRTCTLRPFLASENDHVIARLEVLVPFRVELVEVGKECEEIINNRVDAAIDAPFGESFGNARSDLKLFTFPLASYNFRIRAICDVSDIRTFLRLMLMAHSI